jgi:KTSC domain
MDRLPVNSSNVASVGYEEEASILEVEFLSGSIYRYFGVPSRHFVALTGGQVSVGQYLNTEIKPRYRYERVA